MKAIFKAFQSLPKTEIKINLLPQPKKFDTIWVRSKTSFCGGKFPHQNRGTNTVNRFPTATGAVMLEQQDLDASMQPLFEFYSKSIIN